MSPTPSLPPDSRVSLRVCVCRQGNAIDFCLALRTDPKCGSRTDGGMLSSRAKSVNFMFALSGNAVPEERDGREAAQRLLVLAGGVARWPRGPSFWRAGWQGGQEPPRSGGRGGEIGRTPAGWPGGTMGTFLNW